MTAITTAYDVGDTVYYVQKDTGVHQGQVKSIHIIVTASGNDIMYSILFTDTRFNSISAIESDVFNNIDLALAAYKVLILL